ncbi:hypothetical protein [Legionella septentrionalis]|uniref:hypothetical protein n=1 Tax=Legionella septentrionalis TaxID=2498109 RepID=UPI000F8DD8E8|nr:hypothetical protein [Legionella septentrionalis]RUQ97070.1 hypothetical protein ELY11_06930 [Legionella septentrionalis]
MPEPENLNTQTVNQDKTKQNSPIPGPEKKLDAAPAEEDKAATPSKSKEEGKNQEAKASVSSPIHQMAEGMKDEWMKNMLKVLAEMMEMLEAQKNSQFQKDFDEKMQGVFTALKDNIKNRFTKQEKKEEEKEEKLKENTSEQDKKLQEKEKENQEKINKVEDKSVDNQIKQTQEQQQMQQKVEEIANNPELVNQDTVEEEVSEQIQDLSGEQDNKLSNETKQESLQSDANMQQQINENAGVKNAPQMSKVPDSENGTKQFSKESEEEYNSQVEQKNQANVQQQSQQTQTMESNVQATPPT